MARHRPLPTGSVNNAQALSFAAVLGLASMAMLWLLVNPLTAVLTFLSLIGYAVIYTVWLNRATSQNIVICGAAGAAPPVLGWAAVTNSIDPNALLLFLIIFIWTPPHFWALAIARRDEYARAGIPMLPVTHGIPYTRLQVLLYTVLLVLVTFMPFLTGMSGLIYLATTLVLNGIFLYYSFAMKFTGRGELPMKVFKFSVQYLMYLFAALLVDHYVPTTQLLVPVGP
jgi:protoheme IX farnesyltransferase